MKKMNPIIFNYIRVYTYLIYSEAFLNENMFDKTKAIGMLKYAERMLQSDVPNSEKKYYKNIDSKIKYCCSKIENSYTKKKAFIVDIKSRIKAAEFVCVVRILMNSK